MLASAVPIVGSVTCTPDTRFSYSSNVSSASGVFSAGIPSSPISVPPLEASSEANGWTTPAAHELISPRPCRVIVSPSRTVSASAAAISSSHVAGGASMPASSNSAVL